MEQSGRDPPQVIGIPVRSLGSQPCEFRVAGAGRVAERNPARTVALALVHILEQILKEHGAKLHLGAARSRAGATIEVAETCLVGWQRTVSLRRTASTSWKGFESARARTDASSRVAA
jgi:hypothetical protein